MDYFQDIEQRAQSFLRHAPSFIDDQWLFNLTYANVSDKGMLDVFSSFLNGKNFKKIEYIPAYGEGVTGLSVSLRVFFIRKELNALAAAASLAHEIAHVWLDDTLGISAKDLCAQEQIAELVACQLLGELGFDVREPSAKYLGAWRWADEQVLAPNIDIYADLVYNALRDDLLSFLKDGEHGRHDNTAI